MMGPLYSLSLVLAELAGSHRILPESDACLAYHLLPCQNTQLVRALQRPFFSPVGQGIDFDGFDRVCCMQDTAASYGVGALGGLMYLRLLNRSVDSLAASSQGAADGQARFAIPVLLVLLYNR